MEPIYYQLKYGLPIVSGFIPWVFLDTDNYNSASLENCHYNSGILKHAITIIGLPESCHFLRIPAALGPLSDADAYAEGV